MAQSFIAYNNPLPEISGRCPWEKPASFLVKDETAPNGWRVNEEGRRPSKLLLTGKLRQAVDRWRDEDYPGASPVAARLFEYWFKEDHEVAGFAGVFRYHFCQREAIETLVYLVEIAGVRDAVKLVQDYAEVFQKDLLEKNIEFVTTMDGQRRIRRYVPELEAMGEQDLPMENLRRYAVKMATGSGKTWVMAMAMVWSHFHKRMVAGSELSTNFLIVAPNVIVYQRLERDFAGNRIFNELPLVPPEWTWSQKVILRGESAEPDPSANLFLTNIHQLYESREQELTPLNAVDALLGRKTSKDLASYQRSMLERIRGLNDLVAINDEAHHVHDEDLKWSQSLASVHRALPRGLSLWLDFSATPKDQNGMYFPWTICDYPLAQTVEDRIVKAPLIVTLEDDPKRPNDPDNVTKADVVDKYGFWIEAAVKRWKEHYQTYSPLGTKPVLFIMAEKNDHADEIGRHLIENLKFKKSEVLVIHTDKNGEIKKNQLEEARRVAGSIDQPKNKIKAIVSVMMLREGWDVRNVTVALGLRPFSAQAEILPEQVIGRGLRLMQGVGPDHTQTLEVLGTPNLLKVLREQLETEGVGVGVTKTAPPQPIWIEPIKERVKYDIVIPKTKPLLTHNNRKLSSIDPLGFEAIYDQEELDEIIRVNLRMEFATTETEVHQTDLGAEHLPLAQELIGAITNKVTRRVGLPTAFAQLYPKVRDYVAARCFGREMDVEGEIIREHLRRQVLQEGIVKYLARKIGEAMVEKQAIEFEKASLKLSNTKEFPWKRNLTPEPVAAKKTIFNFVATYNDFERRFAYFLDEARDVLRFASLGTTEQGEAGVRFRVRYLKSSGAIGLYHPDWVVVQKTPQGEINWIIETKGRVWEGTEAKDEAMNDWCQRVSQQSDGQWRYKRVNQRDFDKLKPKLFDELI
jgi:type III restriction enzyme